MTDDLHNLQKKLIELIESTPDKHILTLIYEILLKLKNM